jgi:hypothetical protein
MLEAQNRAIQHKEIEHFHIFAPPSQNGDAQAPDAIAR